MHSVGAGKQKEGNRDLTMSIPFFYCDASSSSSSVNAIISCLREVKLLAHRFPSGPCYNFTSILSLFKSTKELSMSFCEVISLVENFLSSSIVR